MKLVSTKNTYSLTAESIDSVSEDVQSFLKKLKVQSKNIIQTRLTVEEILIRIMEKFGSDSSFTYTKSDFLGRPYISVSFEGEQFNPLENKDDDVFGDWSSTLIQNADYTPFYSFNKGVNSVTINFFKKGVNPVLKLSLTIALAIIVSLIKFSVPENSISFITDNLLTPLYNAFLGLMTTVEIPLVFLSVVCGIKGIGDSSVFGKIGRKMILRFVTVILAFTSAAGVFFSILFLNLSGKNQGEISVKVGLELLLNLIPKNLIEPIISGNTMQVVVMAVVIGISLVVLGEKSKTISAILNEGNKIIVYITGLISKLLPVFIFIILLHMIWEGNISTLIGMWKPIAAFASVLIVLFALMLIYTSLKLKISGLLLIKKILPTFLISFGTASSIAANGECSDCLEKKCGVNKRFVEFGQPVGGVVFMPSTAINFMVCAVYMASFYKVDVSLLWFVIAVVICTFVAVATPPVPGGAIAAYTVIFAQLGIPSQALAIVVALDIIFDFIATAFDSSFLQFELINQANNNKMLNMEILKKR